MSIQTPKIVRVDSKRNQRTLARQVDVSGFGFWSSQDVVYSFRPSSCNSGVRFFRADLPDSPPICARVENRVDKPRQTSLAVDGAQVDMVEHVLAALRAARVDNCDVVVTAPEAPGLDGSSVQFLSAFLDAGTVEQDCARIALQVVAPGIIPELGGAPDAQIELEPPRDQETYYEYNLVYDFQSAIPNQLASFDFAQSPQDFAREIAPCRTFLTLAEANELRKLGICQRVTEKDALVFDQGAPIDNPLRFANECARHKLLDMVGDFALAPVDWIGRFTATKTGHQQNANAVRYLLNQVAWRY